MTVASEIKGTKISLQEQLDVNFFKDLFCMAISSPAIEAALWTCMNRCTYNGIKITEDLFEPVEARQDYIPVCFEVARVNIHPFMKSLYAQYQDTFKELVKYFLA